MFIFFLCFLLLPTWSNSSGEEGMSEWWYWHMHISSSYWFSARDVSLSWQLCRWIRNANRVTKFSIYERTEHLWNTPASRISSWTSVKPETVHRTRESAEQWSARRFKQCPCIQTYQSQPGNWGEKKKLKKVIVVSGIVYLWKSLWTWHKLWWFHQLHRLHTARLLDIFWKENNPHWYVKA